MSVPEREINPPVRKVRQPIRCPNCETFMWDGDVVYSLDEELFCSDLCARSAALVRTSVLDLRMRPLVDPEDCDD